MVCKAREDLPDPETPVTTVRVLCSISKSMFLRLWTRAPRTTMLSVDIFPWHYRRIKSHYRIFHYKWSCGMVDRDRGLSSGSHTACLASYRLICTRKRWEHNYAEPTVELRSEPEQHKDVDPQPSHAVPVPGCYVDHDAAHLDRSRPDSRHIPVQERQDPPR